MKNIDAIKKLPLEELAKFLVREEKVDASDYGDGFEPSRFGRTKIYVITDGHFFMSKGDAIEHEIAWLQAEER